MHEWRSSLRAANAAFTPIGLAAAIFALLALSGPGRIDIVDGQTRYEVSRSIVEHGDVQIRNPDVWFGVFPGRDGQSHTYYRFPQSLAGVPALLIADLAGRRSEPRRHFLFVLCSAAAASLLAVVYLYWFLSTGLSRRKAVYWATAGILCTPAWFYGTSAFDDIFGAVAVTSAVALAIGTRASGSHLPALLAGLLIGLAFNCKQPLGIFALAVLAACDIPTVPRRERLQNAAVVSLGVLAGLVLYVAFDLWKFPPGIKDQHAELLKEYFPVFTEFSWIAPLALAFSPAAGALWYFPPVLLCVAGLRQFVRRERVVSAALLISVSVFVAVICAISFFKGDPAWGPRYLTPVFAIVWLFAPAGAARFRRSETVTLLLLGAFVQVAALTVDPYRLYIQRGLPSTFGAIAPALYFDPANSHLLTRPREVMEIWEARREHGVAFTPWPTPTSTVTILDRVELGQTAINRYKVLNSFRPWWASHWYMAIDDRPVHIGTTAAALALLGVVGVGMTLMGLRTAERRRCGAAASR